jgi:N,N'-diacetyllegionaminate synthase
MNDKHIVVGKRKIGPGAPVFIIAEAGINHNGRLDYALRMVRAAQACGADAVKFQIFSADALLGMSHPRYALFKKLELTKAQWQRVAMCAKEEGIIFFASCFDEESVALADGLGVPLYKVASGDLTHLPLIRLIAAKKRPLILSTGMSLAEEIADALRVVKAAGAKAMLLHCVSNYPASLDELDLRCIPALEEKFGVPVGFSDHTKGALASLIAVAAGACVIEKHFTLNKRLKGPDHALSLGAKEFSELVGMVRVVEKSLGDGVRHMTEPEEKKRIQARRSITAFCEIEKGEKITRENIKIVRPARGILPKYLNKVLGKRAKKHINENDPLTWKSLA